MICFAAQQLDLLEIRGHLHFLLFAARDILEQLRCSPDGVGQTDCSGASFVGRFQHYRCGKLLLHLFFFQGNKIPSARAIS